MSGTGETVALLTIIVSAVDLAWLIDGYARARLVCRSDGGQP